MSILTKKFIKTIGVIFLLFILCFNAIFGMLSTRNSSTGEDSVKKQALKHLKGIKVRKIDGSSSPLFSIDALTHNPRDADFILVKPSVLCQRRVSSGKGDGNILKSEIASPQLVPENEVTFDKKINLDMKIAENGSYLSKNSADVINRDTVLNKESCVSKSNVEKYPNFSPQEYEDDKQMVGASRVFCTDAEKNPLIATDDDIMEFFGPDYTSKGSVVRFSTVDFGFDIKKITKTEETGFETKKIKEKDNDLAVFRINSFKDKVLLTTYAPGNREDVDYVSNFTDIETSKIEKIRKDDPDSQDSSVTVFLNEEKTTTRKYKHEIKQTTENSGTVFATINAVNTTLISEGCNFSIFITTSNGSIATTTGKNVKFAFLVKPGEILKMTYTNTTISTDNVQVRMFFSPGNEHFEMERYKNTTFVISKENHYKKKGLVDRTEQLLEVYTTITREDGQSTSEWHLKFAKILTETREELEHQDKHNRVKTILVKENFLNVRGSRSKQND